MRKRQCKLCPWKVTTNPHDIPGGYSLDKHRALSRTIAEPGRMTCATGAHVMTCHETTSGRCVGWVVNQLGPGNNIPLRIRAMTDETLHGMKVVGEQHERFEDTLP